MLASKSCVTCRDVFYFSGCFFVEDSIEVRFPQLCLIFYTGYHHPSASFMGLSQFLKHPAIDVVILYSLAIFCICAAVCFCLVR